MKLVVGLGNPGLKYEKTRHNAGFLVVDYLAHNLGAAFHASRFQALIAPVAIGGADVRLVKPLTYMNLSGLAVGAMVRFYKLDPGNDLLVICDDLDLPLGRLRFRTRGGHGGQRGLWSIIDALGTDQFCRLRLGIGRPREHEDATERVISPFDAQEETIVDRVILAAADAVRTWLELGAAETMNEFNRFEARDL